MGVKSRTRAENRKDAKKQIAVASLRNNPTSPRKARLVADLIRGQRVELALHILKNNSKQPSIKMRKLLLSAIANWQSKNEGTRIEDADLFVQEIKVDVGRSLKRINTAPQGRAHRIRKRSNHMTIILGSMNPELQVEEEVEEEQVEEETSENTEE
jgi:large subunit ribosomal protein L22